MRNLIIILGMLVMMGSDLLSQPNLDEINIIFKHDFENNTIGKYLVDEYLKDWNNPPWNNRLSTTTIVLDKNDNINKTKSLQLWFPENSLGPEEGGAQWWTELDKQDELYISYDLFYMPGFEFQKGGKLPSVKGGSYNGPGAPTGYNGFSGGLAFNKDGQIRFYIYYPDQATDYGQTIIWGHKYVENAFAPSQIKLEYSSGSAIKCIPGKWHNITYRIVLNTVKTSGGGNYDGILEAYFDGKLVTQLSNILFRHTNDLGVDCMRMYSFFGGNTDDFRNPIEQWLKFDNFLLYTFKSNANVPRGNKLSPTSRTINYWRNFSENPSNITEPTEFISTAQSTSTITLDWAYKSGEEQGFQIERATVPNGSFVPIATIAANTNSYTDNGLDPDRMYYYRLKAFNSTGSSSYVTLQQETSPVLPTNAEKAGFTEVFANVSEANNRRALPVTMQESGTINSISIYHNGGSGNAILGIYSTSETLPGQRIAVTNASPVNSSAGWQTFQLTTPVDVSKGSTIWLSWVFEEGISLRYTSGEPGRAQSADTYAAGMPEAFGTSAVSASIYSIYASYVPKPILAEVPDAPTNLHLVEKDPVSATIGWNDNAQNENGFEIERINTADDTRKTFGTAGNIISLLDEGLTENTTYQYRIRAFNDAGSSTWTDLLTVITPEPEKPVVEQPVDPQNNLPVISNQQFNISEQTLQGNALGTVAATDPDGHQLTYAIVSENPNGLFSINSLTGQLNISNKNVFGPGTLTFQLTVRVTDNAPTKGSSSATVTIRLTGNSNTVYINPDNAGDPLANGSSGHPYDSWSDVTWKTGYTYLQKRGTATTADKILIGANLVTLGAYGEGELPVIMSNTSTYLISGFEKAGITISQLNLQAPNAVSSIYFLGNTGDSTIVEYCQLNANVNAIKVANGNKLVVRYNTISSNSEGVYSSAADNQVYYNIFKNCQEGVNIMGNSVVAKIYNNVFYNNDESLSVTYADLTLFNNIFYMNSPNQKALRVGTGYLQSNNNIYYPEQAGFITIANTAYNSLEQLQQTLNVDMNSFISDPAFVDMYNDNFLLAENSPAINAGIDLNLGIDLLGSCVPLSGAADIGVHEFTGIIAPQENVESHTMRLYPNPSNGKFNVLAEIQEEYAGNVLETSQIRIIDLTGKTIFSRQLEQINETTYYDQIDLTGIANGMYMVVVELAGSIIKEKILINR